MQALRPRQPHVGAGTQLFGACVDQVIADMRMAGRYSGMPEIAIRALAGFRMHIRRGAPCGSAGQRQRHLRDLQLRILGVLRQVRHRAAVHGAAVKIHAGIGPRGILAQDALEDRQWLQQLSPGGLGDRQQAANAVFGSPARPLSGFAWVELRNKLGGL